MENFEFQEMIELGRKVIPDFIDKLSDELSISTVTVERWIAGKSFPKNIAQQFVVGKIQLMIEDAKP